MEENDKKLGKEEMLDYIEENPVKTAVIAAGIGALAGYVAGKLK